jgi:hypothetical protein
VIKVSTVTKTMIADDLGRHLAKDSTVTKTGYDLGEHWIMVNTGTRRMMADNPGEDPGRRISTMTAASPADDLVGQEVKVNPVTMMTVTARLADDGMWHEWVEACLGTP